MRLYTKLNGKLASWGMEGHDFAGAIKSVMREIWPSRGTVLAVIDGGKTASKFASTDDSSNPEPKDVA